MQTVDLRVSWKDYDNTYVDDLLNQLINHTHCTTFGHTQGLGIARSSREEEDQQKGGIIIMEEAIKHYNENDIDDENEDQTDTTTTISGGTDTSSPSGSQAFIRRGDSLLPVNSGDFPEELRVR